jgi:uncharacterized coiled-coil DUF342 family protein
MLVKVPNTPFVRDTESMALINTDTAAQEEYYSKVRIIQNQKQEINTVRTEIDEVRNQLEEIKNLVAKLLDKGSNV